MKYSAEESKRFGFQLYTTALNALEPEQLLEDLLENDVDVALVRIPSSRQTELYKLHAQGIPYLVADTTIEFSLKLRDQEEPELVNKDLKFLPCPGSGETLPLVMEAMLEETWPKFPEPYSANPYLKKNKLKDSYRDLVKSCAGTQGRTWLMHKNDQPAGFVAGVFNGTSNFEIVEVAELPEFESREIFADAVRSVPFLLQSEGVRVVKATAQVQQLKQQQDLISAGYSLSRSLLNIQLYPFFQMAKSGKSTPELNPIGNGPELQEAVNNQLQTYLINRNYTLISLQETYRPALETDMAFTCRFSDLIPIPEERTGLVAITLTNSRQTVAGLIQAFVRVNNSN
jgi:hypothetical protein